MKISNIRYIADEKDGPAVGVCYDFDNEDQVWSGEVSSVLFAEQDEATIEAFGTDIGSFVVHASKRDGIQILARATNESVAMDLAIAYSEWLAKP